MKQMLSASAYYHYISTWLNEVLNYFKQPEIQEGPEELIWEETDPQYKVELTEFQKVKQVFNGITDMLVIGQETLNNLDDEDKLWVTNVVGLKNVAIFNDNSLVNIAIIKTR